MPAAPSSQIANALWSLHAVGAALFGIVWVVVLAVTLGERKPDDNLSLNVTVSYPAWEQGNSSDGTDIWGNDNETSCFQDYVDNSTNKTHFVQCNNGGDRAENLYELDILWLTVSILVLSSLVHILLAMPKRLKMWGVYINQLVAGINVFRWVDYMVVSPLAIVLVASVVGVLDVRTHVLLYVLSSVAAVFGLLSEVMGYIATYVNGSHEKKDGEEEDEEDREIGAHVPLRMSLKYGSRPVGALLSMSGDANGKILTNGEKRLLQALPLFFGLVCQVGVWFTILQTTVLAAELKGAEQPSIIFAIAVVHCVFSFLLTAVGAVQASGAASAISCEFAYLVLNLVSRITLGLMVLSGLLVHGEILGPLHELRVVD